MGGGGGGGEQPTCLLAGSPFPGDTLPPTVLSFVRRRRQPRVLVQTCLPSALGVGAVGHELSVRVEPYGAHRECLGEGSCGLLPLSLPFGRDNPLGLPVGDGRRARPRGHTALRSRSGRRSDRGLTRSTPATAQLKFNTLNAFFFRHRGFASGGAQILWRRG